MRDMVVCKRIVRPERGRKMTLIYAATVDELYDSSTVARVESYGVCVMVKESGEEAVARHITLHGSEIFSLIELLAVNYVTPTTLFDVVSDWLCRDN